MYLRSRLALSFLISALMTVLLAGYFFSRTARRLLEEQYLQMLRETAGLILPGVRAVYLADPDSIDRKLDLIARGLATRVTVIDTSGTVRGDSQRFGSDLEQMENHAGRPEVAAALQGKTGSHSRVSSTLGISFLYFAQPIWDQGRVAGVLRVAVPLVQLKRIDKLRNRFVGAGVAAVVAAALLLAALLSGWFTRPMQRLQARADAIARGDYRGGPGAAGTGELSELDLTIKRIAESLETTIRRLEADRKVQDAILSALQDGVIAVDAQGTIVQANAAAARLVGAQSQLVGRDMFELFRQPEAVALLSRLQNGQASEADLELPGPTRRSLRLSATPVRADRGAFTGLLVLADVTPYVATLRMRRDFFNNASHELRTPLTSIIGYLENLADELPPESGLRAAYLDVLVRQAQRMRRIVDDLLTLAQVESEQWPPRAEPYDLAQQVEQLLEQFRPAAYAQKQTLVQAGAPGPVDVVADREKIQIALSNLIDNAVKYSGRGSRIEVHLARLEGQVEVSVSDNGPGIPKDETARIFERFYRLDKSRSRALGGTGLGLSIVRHILAAHDSPVDVESDTGLGARFSFRLPAAPAPV